MIYEYIVIKFIIFIMEKVVDFLNRRNINLAIRGLYISKHSTY